MADEDVVSMTWGETAGLAAKDGSPQARDRLYAVVAKLSAAAKATNRQATFRRAPAPRVDEVSEADAYKALREMVAKVEDPKWGPEQFLPKHAALLEVDESGSKLFFPDKAPRWVLAADVAKRGVFQTGKEPRRFFQLFESQSDLPP